MAEELSDLDAGRAYPVLEELPFPAAQDKFVVSHKLKEIGWRFVTLSTLTFVGQVLTAVTMIVIARRISRENFGVLSIAQSITQLMTHVVSLGLTTLCAKEVALGKKRVEFYASNTVALSLIMGLVVLAAMYPLCFLLHYPPAVRSFVMKWSTSLLLFACTIEGIMVGLNWFGIQGLARATRPVLLLLFIYLFAISDINFSSLPLLNNVSWAGYLLVMAVPYWRKFRGMAHHRIVPREWKSLLTSGVPLMFLNLLQESKLVVGVQLLATAHLITAAGEFNAAARLVSVLIMVGLNLALTLLPAISGDKERRHAILRSTVRWAIPLLTLVTILGIAAAPEIIKALYGPRYSQSVVVFRWLALALPFSVLNLIYGYFQIASERQNIYLKATGAAVLLNVILTFAVVHWSPMLASFGYISGEALCLGILLWATYLNPVGGGDQLRTETL